MRNFAITVALLTGLGEARAAISFMHDVAPVLLQRCEGCHGSKRSKGDYRLHTFEFLSEAVTPRKPHESYLYTVLVDDDPDSRMPQKDDSLAPSDIELVRQWIAEGAKFDGSDPKMSLRSQLPPRKHPQSPERYRVPVPVTALAFSPDGKSLAVSGHHEVSVWGAESGKLIRRLKNLPLRIQTLKWHSGGERLIVGGGSPGEYGELAVVDALSGERLRVFDTFEDIVLGMALNQAGDRLTASSADRRVRAYDFANGNRCWESSVHSDWVTSVAFSIDNRFVVTTSRDQTAKVLDAQTGELFTTYNGHRRKFGKFTGRFKVFASVFEPISGLVMTVGEGKAIRVWNPVKAEEESGTASDMEKRFSKAGHTRYIEHGLRMGVFAMCTSKNLVYTAGADGVAKAFNFEDGKVLHEFKGHLDWIYSIDCSPKTSRLATGSYSGEVRLWDTDTGEVVNSFIAAPGYDVKQAIFDN